jgi:hypothetical protein
MVAPEEWIVPLFTRADTVELGMVCSCVSVAGLAAATSPNLAPVEFYYRPPGTTGAADVLFERDTFRTNGSGTTVNNYAYEHIYGGYFQDRWKPRSNVSVKAGFRGAFGSLAKSVNLGASPSTQ